MTNWPNEPAEDTTPMAQERFSAGMLRPMTPNTTAKVVPAWAAPTNKPAVSISPQVVLACAMPHNPATYISPPIKITRKAPKRSASMPEKMPNTPQLMFWMPTASAKSSRPQPMSWVMGCIHRPKPWRMPMAMDTISAPQASTCQRGRVLSLLRMA